MDREQEERYIDLAADTRSCCVPKSPMRFWKPARRGRADRVMEGFLATGHSQWILLKYRRRLPQAMINNNILQLWLRACRLHTNRLMGEPDPDWDKPFSRWRICLRADPASYPPFIRPAGQVPNA